MPATYDTDISREPAYDCDHEAVTNGVCMECGEQTGPITVTVTLTGLPANCPHCAAYPPDRQWALGSFKGVLQVICPLCFTAIAPVRATCPTTL
jgi:hypothetical protein